MYLTIFLTIVRLISQVHASSQNEDQQCQLLARGLNISDTTAVELLQRSCEDIKDFDAIQKTHLACAFASATWRQESSSADQLARYIGPLSPDFSNRTTANWYVVYLSAQLGCRVC